MAALRKARQKTAAPSSLRILFIGNSFTARNNLRGVVEQIAAAAGVRMEHRLISVNGASLRLHWNKGEARKVIEAERWDYVVLQEQSTLPIKNPTRMHENIRLFDEIIRNAGAKTALYMTWAREHTPSSEAAITEAYLSVANETGATLCKVGDVWRNVLATPVHPELFDRDGSHPSPAGTYLAACVIFSTMFRQQIPEQMHFVGLTRADVQTLRNIVQRSLLSARQLPVPTGIAHKSATTQTRGRASTSRARGNR